MNMRNVSSLPYRPSVGMMIVNKDNEVFVGRRIDARMVSWQMPQGGIDLGETPSSAALREMHEEIGSDKGYIMAESKKWYSYRVPEYLIPILWDGKYCGQRQKWFLIRFTGGDNDININATHPEFDDWKWVKIEVLLTEMIHVKLKLYEQVANEFIPLLQKDNKSR